MRTFTKISFSVSAALMIAVPAAILGFSGGPPRRKTGAPGDTNCTDCHTGSAITASAAIKLNGMSHGGSGTYTPGGAKQAWTVTVEDPQGFFFGFQLSARLASDERNGQAGMLDASDSATRVICDDSSTKPAGQPCANNAVQFIEHTTPRASGSWSLDWTPPGTNVGDIKIYIAANAANGNGLNSGDRIHLASFTLTPAVSGPRPTIGTGGVVDAWGFQRVISDGMWISIFGSNLSRTTRGWRAEEIVDGRFPTELDGVMVKINNKDAFVNFVSPWQVNVQAPSDGATGMVAVQLTTENGVSDQVMVEKRSIAPSLFVWPAGTATEGNKYVGALFSDFTYVGKPGLLQPAGITTRPARPDEFVLLFATGCGPTNPAVDAGVVVGTPAPRLTSDIEVRIGGVKAEVFENTGFLIFNGECQFNVKVPASLADGDHKVDLDIGGAGAPDDNTFLTVQR